MNENEAINPLDGLGKTNGGTIDKSNKYDKLSFHGQGSTYFGIVALNILLTLITLGLYYPWAKTAYRKYIWNETEFKGSRFVFNGTGKEVFKGFIIAYLILVAIYLSAFLITIIGTAAFVILGVAYLSLLFLIPFAIFGGWRYRVTRTSWRGIFFSFDGNFKGFLKMFVPQLLLTIITLGLYGSWMQVKVMKYLFSHTSIGDLRLDFKGEGATYFGINFVGLLLSYITLFIYMPVWFKDRFNFTITNTSLKDSTHERLMGSSLKGGEAWKTLMVNAVMLVFTLGLAFPWTLMRSMRMYCRNAWIPDSFNWDELSQTENDFKGAAGDEMGDLIDMDFGF